MLALRTPVNMDNTGTRARLRSTALKLPKPLLKVRPQSHRRRCTHNHTDNDVRAARPYSTKAQSRQARHRSHDGARGPLPHVDADLTGYESLHRRASSTKAVGAPDESLLLLVAHVDERYV